MPRTPPGWNTTLEHYAHYWGSALGKSNQKAKSQMRDIRGGVSGTWGSTDDPLGSHTPMAQNAILKRLAKLAAGRIDDWESHVDPTLSPGENYRILLEKGGELPADEKEEVRRAIAATVDEREQSRAAELLRENADAIEAGDKQQLADDIADEYGEAFVSETLRDLRTSDERAAEVTIEPAEPEPAAEPEPIETPADPVQEPAESTEPTESEQASTETTTDAPADPTLEPVATADSGVNLGILTGFIQILVAMFRAGKSDSQNRPTAGSQTTLKDY